jgi:hypothetical protein
MTRCLVTSQCGSQRAYGVCMCAHVRIHETNKMDVCMYACMHVCMYACAQHPQRGELGQKHARSVVWACIRVLSISVCMCVHIYIYIYIYIYICIDTYTLIYVHRYIHKDRQPTIVCYLHGYVDAFVFAHTQRRMHTYIHT